MLPVGFFNIVGMVLLLVMFFLFVWTIGLFHRFLKTIGIKIRVVLRSTIETGMPLGDLYHPLKADTTPLYKNLE